MAVKQNNAETQESGNASSNTNSTQTVTVISAAVKLTAEDGEQQQLQQQQQQHEAGGGGGEIAALREISDIQLQIKSLVNIMQGINPNDRHLTLLRYQHVIYGLAHMQISTTNTKDLTLFKEEIVQVANMLMLPNKKEYLMFYLSIVYQLISQSESQSNSKPPSVALAIVFQLFSPELILEAVQSLLERNVQDECIRKTVELLCNWLRICNFCQNLNLWIMALLQGLREQEKYQLLDEIAMDNIEVLFQHMIFPALRPKVAPIVFHMLSTINQAPEIFHKVKYCALVNIL